MCAQRRNQQPKKSAPAASEQLAAVDLEKVEGAEASDATSKPDFKLVLKDEVKTDEQISDNTAPVDVLPQTNAVQDAVQTQPEDAQLSVQSSHENAQLSVHMEDSEPVVDLETEGIAEILAVTSQSEHGFWRAGIRFSRREAVLISVHEDGHGLCGDHHLSAHKVSLIRKEPHLTIQVIHPETN